MHDAADACREQGLVFFPIAFEALGGVHQVAVTQLKRLGAALARHSGSDEREVVSQLSFKKWQEMKYPPVFRMICAKGKIIIKVSLAHNRL